MGVQAAGARGTAFFDELRDTWRRAADTAGSVEVRRYRVAGAALELRFAGSVLVDPLTRALAHLARPSLADDSLVVWAWESETTSTGMPHTPWNADDYREYGKIRGFFDERFQSVFQWGSHSLVVLDVDRNEAVYWVETAEQIPFFEMAAPLRLVLHGWLRTKGIELVHAAAVGSARRLRPPRRQGGLGQVLDGSGGGEKRSANPRRRLLPRFPRHTGRCLERLQRCEDPRGRDSNRLPFLGEMVSNPKRPDDDKAVYFLHEHMPDRLLLEADLRAIVIPRRTTTQSAVLSPAPRGAALAALAPSTILQLPAAGAETLERLTELVRNVPTYFLDVGSELDAVGPAITPLLEPRSIG